MGTWNGTYSLIQYVPNPLRQEAINIGALLVLPNVFAQVQLVDSFSRVHEAFGGLVDASLIESQVHSFKMSLARSNPLTREDIDNFRDQLCNEVRMTPPRDVIVLGSPEKELDRLTNELVACSPKRKHTLNLEVLSEEEAHAYVSRFFSKEARIQAVNSRIDVLLGELQVIRSSIQGRLAEEKNVQRELAQLKSDLASMRV